MAHPGLDRTPLRLQLWRLARLVWHVLGVWLHATWRAEIAPVERQRLVQRWSAELLAILNVRLIYSGCVPRPGQPLLLVANHISWMDVQALGSVVGARFVAKHEVRDWPLVGKTAAHSGSFFLKRGSCRDAWRIKNRMASALRGGESVAAFPESTTTDGSRVNAFYPAMLQAAVDAGVAVCPVTLRYQSANRTGSAAVAFLGEMTFAESLKRVLREPLIAVEVSFGAPISPRNRTRRELATLAQLAITQTLAFSSPDALTNAIRSAQAAEGRRPRRSLRDGAFPTAQAPAAA
ncbi:MAG TPA: lysophospholipid acyltransferase family protein [Candidatus Kryptonia bacterium]|nr:lysophospholipid acyltransferase family protein [Candidatus Kryptonia bacterium]